MTSFSDQFPHRALLDTLGDDVIYKRGSKTYAIKASVEHNVERVGNDGYVTERRTEIEFLKTDVPLQPIRGDLIKENTTTFTVDGIVSDDGSYIRVYVH